MPPELRDTQLKSAKKGKQYEEKKKAREAAAKPHEAALFDAPNYSFDVVCNLWVRDCNQPGILPPSVTHYNGWPERPYSFHHLHGVQEINLPWSEFLYAWAPSNGLKPFPFVKTAQHVEHLA